MTSTYIDKEEKELIKKICEVREIFATGECINCKGSSNPDDPWWDVSERIKRKAFDIAMTEILESDRFAELHTAIATELDDEERQL